MILGCPDWSVAACYQLIFSKNMASGDRDYRSSVCSKTPVSWYTVIWKIKFSFCQDITKRTRVMSLLWGSLWLIVNTIIIIATLLVSHPNHSSVFIRTNPVRPETSVHAKSQLFRVSCCDTKTHDSPSVCLHLTTLTLLGLSSFTLSRIELSKLPSNAVNGCKKYTFWNSTVSQECHDWWKAVCCVISKTEILNLQTKRQTQITTAKSCPRFFRRNFYLV